MLYAFDLLEFDGKDLRPQPLSERKAKLVSQAPGLRHKPGDRSP
jgi:ATP-dependent DNA ligase